MHFKVLSQLWLSKVKGPALPKERWRKGVVFVSLPEVGAHNRVPSRQLYYWVTEPLIGQLINEKGSNSKKTTKKEAVKKCNNSK